MGVFNAIWTFVATIWAPLLALLTAFGVDVTDWTLPQ